MNRTVWPLVTFGPAPTISGCATVSLSGVGLGTVIFAGWEVSCGTSTVGKPALGGTAVPSAWFSLLRTSRTSMTNRSASSMVRPGGSEAWLYIWWAGTPTRTRTPVF